ncbi:X-linked retinitis pigmentosa GTPase regulator [Wickerhamomyces ciferrii]|uniref:X-linked retinitis pigmentosa GTPase regulator n=1 Tax=Wickerhamomyces ciferrii (strain ATCC 14091 / BCRC 22168 / CBS 111 / JCM 3599 / NBRC 0793 / NRRL Y-1031 F-60-10) TaxID=1206466 RepID=K0KUS4_WICCF|nr:X-linked retinitis pigmentosa GTPase regulator [Wickerhamomyces ciferrii]CCH46961.1 X-linked retinitis pigmentosa GTPase regulator [Wickerhamomyces ciferrii]
MMSLNNHKQDKRQLDLPDTQWSLVFTTKGSHFFHNKETKESHWKIDDELVLQKVQDIEKDSLLLLIAKSRGLKLTEEQDSILNNSLVPKKEELQDDHGELDNEDEDEQKVQEMLKGLESDDEDETPKIEQITQKPVNPLVSGYSSSEDDSDNEDEVKVEEKIETSENTDEINESKVEPSKDITDQVNVLETELSEEPNDEGAESSEEENAIDLDMLNDLSSDEGESKDPQQAEAIFFELLQESELNPFGTWESESLKLINDPRFYEIDDNRDRKRIFDGWASIAVTLKQQNTDDTKELKEENAGDEEPEEPFVKFIKFLESRDELDRLYVDFKKKWKKKLKKFDLGDREKEKTYKEYLVYHKKPLDDRITIFKDFLLKSKIFKHNSKKLEDKESCNSIIKEVESYNEQNNQDIKLGYKLLHQIEDLLQISESLKFDIKYYITPIGKRLQIINEVYNLLDGV